MIKRVFIYLIFIFCGIVGGVDVSFGASSASAEDSIVRLPKNVDISAEDRVLIDRAISSILLQSGKSVEKDGTKNIYQKIINEGVFLQEQEFVLQLLSKNADDVGKYSLAEQIFTDDALKNLEVLEGRSDKFYNFSRIINRAKTYFGKGVFSRLLLTPTSSIGDIVRRQKVSRELVENEYLFNEIENITEEFKNIESYFISLWNDTREYNALLGNQYYFKNSFFAGTMQLVLPKKTYNRLFNYLDKKTGVLEVNFPFATVGHIAALVSAINIYYLFSGRIFRFVKEHRGDSFGKWGEKWGEKFENISNARRDSGEGGFKKGCKTVGSIFELQRFFIEHMAAPFSLFICVSSIRSLLQQINFDVKSFNLAHKHLVALSSVVNKSLSKLKDLSDENEVLRNGIPSLYSIDVLLDNTKSKLVDLEKLLKALKKRTFGKNLKFPMVSSFRGRVLSAYKMLDEVKDNFLNIFEAIGELDAYLAVAKLIKDSDEHAPYCFVDFRYSSVPSIKLDSCWNPFVSSEEIVTNDISLGSLDSSGSAVITGPNAGGKSTLMKTIALSILTAQSFGIAPAAKAEMTPFSYIDSHMAKEDDISKKKSSYMAEALQIKKIVSTLKSLPADEFGCVFMDELFNTTNPQEAPAMGRAIGRYLSERSNVMTVISSHYSELTKLEKETNGIFKNYHVVAERKPDGSIFFPFKIHRGKATQSIALDLLEDIEMDAEIIKVARTFV
jgi:DNA mismatch repair protein MutS